MIRQRATQSCCLGLKRYTKQGEDHKTDGWQTKCTPCLMVLFFIWTFAKKGKKPQINHVLLINMTDIQKNGITFVKTLV